MRVWNGIDDLAADRGPVASSIGNYDGVHRGHRAILERVVHDAASRRIAATLITFDPHPLTVVAPERRPDLVQTRGQKLASLERAGLDEVLIVRFDAELAALDGNDFFERYLLPRFPVASMHVGENFRFGRGRSGDLDLLRDVGRRAGFEVHGVPAVKAGDVTVSSSAIRDAVRRGEVAHAARLLGRPFALTGLVARGERRGREIGFPTANLEPDNMLLPLGGVYVGEAQTLDARYPAMINVGLRPTFGGERLSVEAHLLEFEGDLYGQRLELSFQERLRDERRFEDAAELAAQLQRDRDAARAHFDRREARAE